MYGNGPWCSEFPIACEEVLASGTPRLLRRALLRLKIDAFWFYRKDSSDVRVWVSWEKLNDGGYFLKNEVTFFEHTFRFFLMPASCTWHHITLWNHTSKYSRTNGISEVYTEGINQRSRFMVWVLGLYRSKGSALYRPDFGKARGQGLCCMYNLSLLFL